MSKQTSNHIQSKLLIYMALKDLWSKRFRSVLTITGVTVGVGSSLDDNTPSQEEVDVLMREGSLMIPELGKGEAVRVYAGIRPLLQPVNTDNVVASSRSISRGFQVLDHTKDGIANFITITGGKVTLYQLMTDTVMSVLDERYA